MVHLLLKANADYTVEGPFGPALQEALWRGHADVAAVLRAVGVRWPFLPRRFSIRNFYYRGIFLCCDLGGEWHPRCCFWLNGTYDVPPPPSPRRRRPIGLPGHLRRRRPRLAQTVGL